MRPHNSNDHFKCHTDPRASTAKSASAGRSGMRTDYLFTFTTACFDTACLPAHSLRLASTVACVAGDVNARRVPRRRAHPRTVQPTLRLPLQAMLTPGTQRRLV